MPFCAKIGSDPSIMEGPWHSFHGRGHLERKALLPEFWPQDGCDRLKRVLGYWFWNDEWKSSIWCLLYLIWLAPSGARKKQS